jgi:membrane-bound lytic murein transglycosylase F
MTTRRILLLLACLAAGCTEGTKPIAPVAQSGELVVLTVNGPATYFEDAQGQPSGFEYDLATLFARSLDAKVSFVVTDSPAKIDKALRAGQAHLAAAALPRHFDYPSRRSTRSSGAHRSRNRRTSRPFRASASA